MVEIIKICLILGLLLTPFQALATPYSVSFSGRITEGAMPRTGPIQMSFSFYRQETGGESVINAVNLPSVKLLDGIFDVDLDLTEQQYKTVFNGVDEVWIGVAAPNYKSSRYRLSAAPVAYRIKVDDSTLKYGADGKLAVQASFLTGLQPKIESTTSLTVNTLTTHTSDGLTISPIGTAPGETGTLTFGGLGDTTKVGFRAPDDVSTNTIWTLPQGDGTSGQVLLTDGVGNLYFGQNDSNAGSSCNDGYVFDGDGVCYPRGALGSLGAIAGGSGGTLTDGSLTGVDFSGSAGIEDSKLVTISAAGQVSGSAITSGTIGGSTSVNTTGSVSAASLGANGYLTVNPVAAVPSLLKLETDDGSQHVGFQAPVTIGTNLVWELPDGDGTNGQILETDGLGTLSWVDQPTAVTSANSATGVVSLSAGDLGALPTSDLGAVNGVATLNGSSLVIQDPANANPVPALNSIVMADSGGKMNLGWLPPTLTGKSADTVDSLDSSDIVPTSRTISSGNGLMGGGSLAGNLTLSVDLAPTNPGLSNNMGAGNDLGINTDDIRSTHLAANAVDSSELANNSLIDSDFGTNLDVSKFDADVSNAEFEYLDGVSSSIQSQLAAKGTLAKGGNSGVVNFGSTNSNDVVLQSNGSPVLEVDSNGQVGIGASPSSTVQVVVGGGLKVGTTPTCDASHEGVIRWNGTNFQGCDGSVWNLLNNNTFSECAVYIDANTAGPYSYQKRDSAYSSGNTQQLTGRVRLEPAGNGDSAEFGIRCR